MLSYVYQFTLPERTFGRDGGEKDKNFRLPFIHRIKGAFIRKGGETGLHLKPNDAVKANHSEESHETTLQSNTHRTPWPNV